jgi:hypothetical protein
MTTLTRRSAADHAAAHPAAHPAAERAARLVALTVLGALVLSGCGQAAGGDLAADGADDGDLVVDGVADLDAMEALLSAHGALSETEQLAQAAAADAEAERLLWTLSGLEEALGGPEAADAAFEAHGQALLAAVEEAAGSPIVLAQGGAGTSRSAASGGPSIGEGLFGGLMTVVLTSGAVVEATNSQSPTGSETFGTNGTISGDTGYVEATQEFVYTDKGVTSRLVVTIDVSPCPDPTGKFEAHANVYVTATTTDGLAGQSGELDVRVEGQVDDDARVASSDVECDMSWDQTGSSGDSLGRTSGAIGDTVTTALNVTAETGPEGKALSETTSKLGLLLAFMIKEKLVEAAAKGWESGRCVSLAPTASPGPQGLDPDETSTLTAAPRSKIDGQAAGGTVTATLSSGGAAVSPTGTKVQADATFTYTAPGERNKTGTVDFEARSRRGVARASITLDTEDEGWVASGGGPGVTVTGLVADLTAPFTLTGAGEGFTVTYSYSPTSETAGTMTYTGSGAGFTMSGSGTYTITGEDPELTLTATHYGCVDIGGCRTNTDVITLTPVY